MKMRDAAYGICNIRVMPDHRSIHSGVAHSVPSSSRVAPGGLRVSGNKLGV